MFLDRLRRTPFLARLVLAWFALSMVAAAASPLVKPQQMELICSGGGIVKVVVQGDDGALEQGAHTLDCPLCIHAAAPPPAVRADVLRLEPPGPELRSVPSERIAARPAAPLPARGPPASS